MRFSIAAAIATIGALSAVGQYLLKTGIAKITAGASSGVSTVDLLLRTATNPHLLLATVIYVVAFAIYLLLLTRLDLSQAFPIAIGVNVLFVAIMAIWWLGETASIQRIAGMALIVTGVYLISR